MVPSIRQLEYFVAVADRLSFGQAADACHVTQPGLSAQIRQLEELLRVRLFERDSRRVLLTRAGEALLPRARDILTAAEELSQAAAAFTRPLSGTLRLGVIPTIAPYLLPDVMAPVHRTYPELRLLVHEGETAAMVEQLSNGQLDLLVLALQADLGDAETHELFKDPFVLAVPSGHRLTAKKSVSESDLEGENVLLLEDGH
jgi:LysR family hydrogen peroxide-inducible transcriptional activator